MLATVAVTQDRQAVRLRVVAGSDTAREIVIPGHLEAATYAHRTMTLAGGRLLWSHADNPAAATAKPADEEVRRVLAQAGLPAGATVFLRLETPELHALPWELALADGYREIVRVHPTAAPPTELGEAVRVVVNSPMAPVAGLAAFHAAAVARTLEICVLQSGVAPANVACEAVAAHLESAPDSTLVFVGHTCEEHAGDHLLLFEERELWREARHVRADQVRRMAAGALVLWSCASRRFLCKLLEVPPAPPWSFALSTNAPLSPASAVEALPAFLGTVRRSGDLLRALAAVRRALADGDDGSPLRAVPALTLVSTDDDPAALREQLCRFHFLASLPGGDGTAGINDRMAEALVVNRAIHAHGTPRGRKAREWLCTIDGMAIPDLHRARIGAIRVMRQQVTRRQLGLDGGDVPAHVTLDVAREYAARQGGRLLHGSEYEHCACGPRLGDRRFEVLPDHPPDLLGFDMPYPRGASIDLWADREWLADGLTVGGRPEHDGGVLACLPQVRHAAPAGGIAAFRVAWEA